MDEQSNTTMFTYLEELIRDIGDSFEAEAAEARKYLEESVLLRAMMDKGWRFIEYGQYRAGHTTTKWWFADDPQNKEVVKYAASLSEAIKSAQNIRERRFRNKYKEKREEQNGEKN